MRFLLLFLVSAAIIAASEADAKNQVAAAAGDSPEEIPTGFKAERYASVWERNPFTFVRPASAQEQHSPFEKLFLTSWLKDGPVNVIFVRNSDTNDSQKITPEPNKDHLRLVALHLNADPNLVEAVISDGKEQGSVKFRFDSQPSVPQPAVAPPQIPSKAAEVAPGTQFSVPVTQPQSNQASGNSTKQQAGPQRVPGKPWANTLMAHQRPGTEAVQLAHP